MLFKVEKCVCGLKRNPHGMINSLRYGRVKVFGRISTLLCKDVYNKDAYNKDR